MRVAKRWLAATLAVGFGLLTAGCSGVVARVNGDDISRKEFVEALERAGGANVLRTLVLHRLIYDRAQAEGLMPTAEDLQNRLKEIKAGEPFNGDEAKWTEYLKQNATDDEVVLDQIKLELAVYRLRTNHLKPDEATLKAFFKENHERLFDKPERVTFRQIVVASPQVAQEVISRLNTEEAIFEQLVKQYSQDQRTAANGGLVQEIPLEMIRQQAAPIYAAILKLKPNQVTQTPVQVPAGDGRFVYVVIKLLDRLAPEPAKWEDPATQKLVREAYLQVNAKSEEEFLAEAAKGANVVILDRRYKETLEPMFQAGVMPNVPPGMQQQLSQPPEITSPTRIRPDEMPKPTMPGDAASAGGN